MELVNVFDNREKAIIIWSIIIIISMLFHGQIRLSVLGVLRAFFAPKLIFPFLLMLLYMALIILILRHYGIWDYLMLKDTIIYGLGIGLVTFFGYSSLREDPEYYKKSIKNIFKMTIFIDFLINFYVFTLWQELLLFPIITFITLIIAVAKTNEKHTIVANFFSKVLAIVGVTLLLIVLYKAIQDYNNLFKLQNLYILLIPPVISVLYMPFNYLIAVYARYEMLFLRLERVMRTKMDLYDYTKRKFLLKFHINLKSLNAAYPQMEIYLREVSNKKDIDKLFNKIK